MKEIINVIIFCLILFIYLHVQYELKYSNYLEVNELNNPSKDKIEEIALKKQPILIINSDIFKETITMEFLLKNYSKYDINLYDKNNDLFITSKLDKYALNDSIDLSSILISYNNSDFIEETNLKDILKNNDYNLRSYYSIYNSYDMLLLKPNIFTELKYNIENRTLLYTFEGNIEITLIPPIYKKYLHTKNRYERLEYFSQINLNNIEDNYKDDYDKVKVININLKSKEILIIPSMWFYSIKTTSSDTIVFCNKYNTITNYIAHFNQHFFHLLQKNNLKINNTKIITGENNKYD